MTTTNVTFKSKSGADASGALAEPNGAGKVPGLVLIQEYWGVNAHVRTLAERLAHGGFLVVAPDLYHGTTTTDAAEASKLMAALDTFTAIQEIAGAADYLKAHARGNGKVGVIGFCLGGALAFASACYVEGLSAVVPFYGVPPADKVDYTKVTAPILAHFAKNDAWASVDKAEAIQKQIPSMKLEIYDAGHAFVNDTRPEAYDEKSATLAWQRTLDFLKNNLT